MTYTAASGIGLLIFIHVTHYCNGKMYSEEKRNAFNVIGRNFIMAQDNDPKHTLHTTWWETPQKEQLTAHHVAAQRNNAIAWQKKKKTQTIGFAMPVLQVLCVGCVLHNPSTLIAMRYWCWVGPLSCPWNSFNYLWHGFHKEWKHSFKKRCMIAVL